MSLTTCDSCVRLDVRGNALKAGHGSNPIRDSSPVGNGTSLFASVQSWLSAFPRRFAVPLWTVFFRPSHGYLTARRLSMPYFNIYPYEFFKNYEGKIVIRQRFVSRAPQEIILSRGQMEVFIEHLQWFLERFDAEKRRIEVEEMIEQSQKIATNRTA